MTESEINKIVKLCYNQFLDESYDLHGITLTPHIFDGRNGNEIFWTYENNKDLSFNRTIIVDYIHEMIMEFSKLVSNRENNVYRDYWKRFCNLKNVDTPRGRVYLNRDDKKKLDGILYNISEINYKKFHSDIDFLGFNLDATASEDFYIGYDCILTNVFYNGDEVEDFSSEYKYLICDLFNNDNFRDYQDDLMLPFTREIVTNPLLFDNEYMYYTNDFAVKDEYGKTLYC